MFLRFKVLYDTFFFSFMEVRDITVDVTTVRLTVSDTSEHQSFSSASIPFLSKSNQHIKFVWNKIVVVVVVVTSTPYVCGFRRGVRQSFT